MSHHLAEARMCVTYENNNETCGVLKRPHFFNAPGSKMRRRGVLSRYLTFWKFVLSEIVPYRL